MSRLTWRQRLIAVAIGIAAAALQARTPVRKLAHPTAVSGTACAAQSTSNC